MSIFGAAVKRVFPDFESRLRVRRIINLPLDVLDKLTGRSDPLIPPRGLWFVGGRKGYSQTNEQLLAYFAAAGLRPDGAVLDIGSGLGIMAARLTRFLRTGSYEGFDIVRTGTDWAREHISSRYPKFGFQHADVWNSHYNPNSLVRPEEFTFPYNAEQFDFAFAKSVFTHMLPASVQRYLHETRRVLKGSGTAVVSCFLINDESIRLLETRKSAMRLVCDHDKWVADRQFPETAVGLPEHDFQQWCALAGLEFAQVDYGSWCGRSEYVTFQDLVVLRLQKSQ